MLPAEFYDILKTSGFDERSSMRQVLKLAPMVNLDSDDSEEDTDDFSKELLRASSSKGVRDEGYVPPIFSFSQ